MFALIGEGEKRAEYEQYVARQHLTNVEVLGAIPWDTVRNYIDSAQVGVQAFCNNSFWRCALSTKIFDYMLAGKPVVFAGEGDTADLINDARAGFVVRPEDHNALADAILRLYQDPAGGIAMGRNGLQYMSANFSAESSARTLASALHPVVQSFN